MYKRISITILFIIGISLSSVAQDKRDSIFISDNLIAQEVIDSVFLVTHYFPWDANCLLVILPDEKAVLIDTPNENSGTKLLLDWIYEYFGDIEIIAVNTGFHVDNLGGNGYLLSQGIPIYGSDLTAKLVNEKGEAHKNVLLEFTSSKEDKKYFNIYKEIEFKPSNMIFKISEGLRIELGGEIFEIYFPGETHTPDNVVVYLHRKNLLFGGCMVISLEREGFGYIGDANMTEGLKSLNRVKEKYNECKIVIHGHGIWGDGELLDYTINLLKNYNRRFNND